MKGVSKAGMAAPHAAMSLSMRSANLHQMKRGAIARVGAGKGALACHVQPKICWEGPSGIGPAEYTHNMYLAAGTMLAPALPGPPPPPPAPLGPAPGTIIADGEGSRWTAPRAAAAAAAEPPSRPRPCACQFEAWCLWMCGWGRAKRGHTACMPTPIICSTFIACALTTHLATWHIWSCSPGLGRHLAAPAQLSCARVGPSTPVVCVMLNRSE